MPARKKPSGHLSWENAKDQFIPWAVATMVGYATYNIDKLTDSVTKLNTILTKSTVVIENHESRLNRQGVLLLEITDKNAIQDAEIAALKALSKKD